MSSVAVATFVKNEASDIATWIAWHISNGAQRLYIYDDHSTDGTWDVIQAAAAVFDIVAERSDLSIEHFYNRQRSAYMDAIRRASHSFDWLGIFDADEYCLIGEGDDIGVFLDQFPEADAVAISWCIYGSSGHVLKPAPPVPEAFNRHSTLDFAHNIHVKSFVRPERVNDEYINPHRFAVMDGRYVNSEGVPSAFTHPGGMPTSWRRARIMHYVCRSMEHFVERMKRRFDIRAYGTKYWNDFDRNEEISTLAHEALVRLYSCLWQIERVYIVTGCAAMQVPDQLKIDNKLGAGHPEIDGPFCFSTEAGGKLVFNVESGHFSIRELENEDIHHVPLYGMVSRPLDGGRMFAFLFSDASARPLFWLGTGQKGEVIAVSAEMQDDGSLKLQDTRALAPLMQDANVDKPKATAFKAAFAAPSEAAQGVIASMRELAAHGRTAQGIASALRERGESLHPSALAAWVFTLPERESLLFRDMPSPLRLPDWVYAYGGAVS